MPHPHETPFTYNNSLVASCATSPLARSLISAGILFSPPHNENHHPDHDGSTSDCLTLLQQHASHYNRSAFSSKERRFWGEWVNTDGFYSDKIDGATQIEDVSTRHETFLHNVMFVHAHNTDENMNHKVALNRFADVPVSEFPNVSSQHDSTQHQNPPLVFNFDDPMFLHLNNEELIMEIGSKIQRRQTINQASSTSFLGNIVQSIKDSWWWSSGGQLSSNRHSSSSSSPHIKPSKKKETKQQDDKWSDSFLLDKQNELGGLENDQNDNNGDTGDQYKTYLNWATEDNPDGVAIVHPSVDQGICGSCWAISALGTMESSVARNMAYIGYETAVKSSTTTKRYLGEEEGKEGDATASKEGDALFEDSRTLAVLAAQQVERKSIDLADLSVQELLDCDTKYDTGCAGGNPLLAFYYLHKYGVTSSKNYPYVGTENVCNLHKVDKPIATVETWGILTADQ